MLIAQPPCTANVRNMDARFIGYAKEAKTLKVVVILFVVYSTTNSQTEISKWLKTIRYTIRMIHSL